MTGKKPLNEAGVGYGRPPLHTRFRKGQSGNPTGKRRRDAATEAKTTLWQELNRPLTLREGEKTTRISALQAVTRSHIAQAVKGSVPAQRSVLLMAATVLQQPPEQPGTGGRFAPPDPDAMSDAELLSWLQERTE
jgi:hypothetical protein